MEKDKTKRRSNDEEPDISNKALFGNGKGPHERHGASDNGGDEASRSYELADRQTPTVRAHRRKCREDVWTAITKSQERDTCQALAHAKQSCDCTEVDAEEVAGRHADRAEEQTEP